MTKAAKSRVCFVWPIDGGFSFILIVLYALNSPSKRKHNVVSIARLFMTFETRYASKQQRLSSEFVFVRECGLSAGSETNKTRPTFLRALSEIFPRLQPTPSLPVNPLFHFRCRNINKDLSSSCSHPSSPIQHLMLRNYMYFKRSRVYWFKQSPTTQFSFVVAMSKFYFKAGD